MVKIVPQPLSCSRSNGKQGVKFCSLNEGLMTEGERDEYSPPLRRSPKKEIPAALSGYDPEMQ